MKTRLWLLALVGAVLLSGGAAWADSEFYVIAGGGGVGTKITSVPYTISAPGFYYLGGNLTYSGAGNAITVNADNVTLDLMGFELNNSGAPGATRGISIGEFNNVEIRNGTVRGFNYGVYGSGARHSFINVRATGNSYGIYLTGYNNLVKGCKCSSNSQTGLYLLGGFITGCVASNNDRGIWLIGPGNVMGNTAFDNSSDNFYFGLGVGTAILVDQNSAFGRPTNYRVVLGTTGIQYGTNAGTP